MLRVKPSTDYKTISELDRSLFPLDDEVELEGARWWVAHDEAKLVAFAGASYLEDIHYVFLRRAGVLPEYRGQGIHRRLLGARIRWAYRLQAEAVITYTIGNTPSSNNLIRSGFELYTPEYQWAGPTALYWARIL